MSDATEAEAELLHTYDPETHVPVERALIEEAFDFIVEHGEGAPTDLERRLRAALSDGAGRSEAVIRAAGDAISHPAVQAFMAAMVPEIKAEALREAADAMRLAKDPGHWNLRDPYDADVAYSPDVWLEHRAARVAGTNDTEGSE